MDNIQKRYRDCINTPNLWLDTAVFGLQQLKLSEDSLPLNSTIDTRLRLGKLVERFICHQLEQSQGITILAENIQIQKEKHTLGELDCILEENGKPIHLEIIYKFYLYDTSVGITELDHWIGPNRNDSLVQKLHKLKEKQLPLLYNTYTQSLLDSLQLQIDSIQQQVCFKAQLFLPLNKKALNFEFINQACIKGIYAKRKELDYFNDCKFYMPKKIDWLLDIDVQIAWQTYSNFLETVTPLLNNKMSPLCWIKKPNGETLKCFVVWW